MGINPTGAVAVPLTVFASWVTEVSPNAVPENVSPDNQEVVYAPGQVGSRPAFQKVFGTAFPGTVVPTLMASYSYTLPTGQIQNLYFDSNGVLWVEYLSVTPGAYTQLYQSTPGSFCKFMGAFGRVYIAISNGLTGADIPLQYDGTYLDRLTSDAPGAAPMVTMLDLPSVAMAAVGGSAVTSAITSVATNNPVQTGPPDSRVTIYTGLLIEVASSAGFATSTPVTLSGTGVSALNVTAEVVSIFGNFIQVNYYNATALSAATGTLTGPATSITLVRANNEVTVTGTSALQVHPGYQVQIAGGGSLAIGGGIASIVINNEDQPGLATVTTNNEHNLIPQLDVTITGVSPVAVGGATLWSAVRSGGLATYTLSSGVHGLAPGAVVQTSASSDASLNTSATVALVPAPNQIAFYQAIDADVTSPVTGITVSLTWPIPDDTPTPTYFEIQACPTPTTFQVQVTYSDGTWTSGAVGFPWDGTFYVTATPNATTAVYQQYGPSGTSSATGTVTPFGQMAPGLHLCAVAGLDRQGGITAISPFSTFIANGGQYPVVSNICTLPANFEARILIFSGAQPNVPGELPPLYYLPNPPQLEGQVVGTATQIDDNTTTSILLDFSDNSLYAGLGVSIPGNNLAEQIVLDGALGFGFYDSRLTTWGQRNTVQNFQNIHGLGGIDPARPLFTFPAGWQGDIYLASASIGSYSFMAFAGSSGSGQQQSAYLDQYGDPIVLPNTQYTFRFKYTPASGMPTNGTLTALLNSTSTGYSSTISFSILTAQTTPKWYEGEFSLKTPATIPFDLNLVIQTSFVGANPLLWCEMQLIYTASPTIPDVAYASYVNNPAGMDGVSGQFGPVDDTHAIMDMSIIRNTLNILTQDPSGRLHETTAGNTEPSGWNVSEVAANCGTLSAFCMTHSQADDTAASGGDDWFAWASEGGAMIFGGGMPEKISQEIQPNWNDPSKSNTSVQINMSAALSIWGVNDPVQRLLMFGVPIGTATAPSQIYVLDYKNLGSAAAIAGSPPFHPSFAGKLIATDNSRKWTHWLRPMNSAARMYRTAGQLSLVFCGGNGQAPGNAAGFGNVYTLNPAKLTDDDYGLIVPYYDTYFFLDPERAQQMQLKGQRILMAYVMAYIQGTGQVTATYFADDLANPWALTTTRTLTAGYFDREFGGGMCTGNRIAIRIGSSPITGTDNGFVMSRLTAFLKDAKLLVRGANQ